VKFDGNILEVGFPIRAGEQAHVLQVGHCVSSVDPPPLKLRAAGHA
jgi:hypothetical protein